MNKILLCAILLATSCTITTNEQKVMPPKPHEPSSLEQIAKPFIVLGGVLAVGATINTIAFGALYILSKNITPK